MNKTKIEYCDMTWNPITGCLHECKYCYARRIARRFQGFAEEGEKWVDFGERETIYDGGESGKLHYLEAQKPITYSKYDKWRIAPFPYGFDPTFHPYRLDEPAKMKKPQTIFVCSMADLFGDFIPDEWIKAVFDACEKAPWHRYLFLTKNSTRYRGIKFSQNMWFGQTITGNSGEYLGRTAGNCFVSIEPLLKKIIARDVWKYLGWVIIGAETGNRKGKVIPQREWIEHIVDSCRESNVPIFMKNNLKDIWREPLIQEYPWEVK